MYKSFLIIFICCLSQFAFAQNAVLQGQIIDAISRKPVQAASIKIQDSDQNTVSDSEGKWSLSLPSGVYNIEIRHIGFQDAIIYEQRIRVVQANLIESELFPSFDNLEEVTIESERIARSAENGNNIKTLEIDEIQRLPGAVMDISKVIRSFPGVSPRVSFGYNIIVRGGGSFENTFYLDGIEIPAITHFNVQGLGGGPNGGINTDLISRATFRSGSFPVNRGNSLSSVMDLEQKTGRRDRFGAKATLGAAEYGLHIEGPLTKHSSYILSARKSYTEYLLKAFNLPVLPAFTDFQYKHKFWLPNQDELTIVGLGMYDKYRLNLEGDNTDALLYNVGFIPEGDQNITTVGANYKHYTDKGTYNFIVSHNNFYNKADKFYGNSGLEEDRSLKFLSQESETKLRFENKIYNEKSKFIYGASYDFVNFDLEQYSIFASRNAEIDTLNFTSTIDYQKYGIFASYSFDINSRWNLNLGARIDGNTFGEKMKNPLQQFSPRGSLQYIINKKFTTTLQGGIYYQAPSNILLAYKEDEELVNQNTLEFIKSSQVSWGLDYTVNKNRKITIDLFYKNYDQYPFLLRDSISFANANGEYVSVGNQKVNSSSVGRAYGAEFFMQQKLTKNWYYNLSASYVVSEFQDENGAYISSAWDNRFFTNLTFGREFKNNWTIGAKFTYAGSNPYTPYDVEKSSNIEFWNANQRGVFDYSRLNQERLSAYHALDFRVDKKWYSDKMTFIAFLDLQNLYNNKFRLVPYLTTNLNEEGDPIINPDNTSQYSTQIINSDTGRVLPTIGFSIEF